MFLIFKMQNIKHLIKNDKGLSCFFILHFALNVFDFSERRTLNNKL